MLSLSGPPVPTLHQGHGSALSLGGVGLSPAPYRAALVVVVERRVKDRVGAWLTPAKRVHARACTGGDECDADTGVGCV